MKLPAPLHIAAILCLLLCASCVKERANGIMSPPEGKIALFSSSDKKLESTFAWAKKTALSYAHDDDDPVGPWYEAALPSREGFCMRDVAHQTVGAHIIGLEKHNSNMLRTFAANISESKDYCSYWEINRYGLPVAADYVSDKEFWYNLNANFDVIQSCWRMFEWTDDNNYISDEAFRKFYSQSLNEYVDRWDLSPEKIMARHTHMNTPENFNPSYQLHVCRGLPSYDENDSEVTLGVDLVAAMAAGYEAYSRICGINGDHAGASSAIVKAETYRNIIDSCWWDDGNRRFNTHLTRNGNFGRGEGIPHLLWFGGIVNPEKIRHAVADILSSDWNVENLSSFPYMLYRYGYNDEAYHILTTLPSESRADYPEVSFALVEGIVCGAMGLVPSACDHSVATLSRIGNHNAKIENVPLWGGFITLAHKNSETSELSNNTSASLIWHASFPGEHKSISAGQSTYSATVTKDVKGNVISTASITVEAGSSVTTHAN